MKILCVGNASYDITIPLLEFPTENKKMRIHEKYECGGGPAATAAYLLGKWGMEVYFAGVVGNDSYGKNIKSELNSVHVKTKYLELNDEFDTTLSYIIASKEKGSRTILTYRQEEMKLKKLELDFEPDVILVDGQEYEITKELFKKYPNAKKIIDAGRPTEKIIELSKMVDYLVCSKEFAEEVTGIKIDYSKQETVINLYKKMKEIFNNTVVVTLESKGSLYEIDGNIKIMSSLKVDVLDSTGAGDIFHGAFTYGIANDLELEEVIKISNIAGAISVTRMGSQTSVPTVGEIDAKYSESV